MTEAPPRKPRPAFSDHTEKFVVVCLGVIVLILAIAALAII